MYYNKYTNHIHTHTFILKQILTKLPGLALSSLHSQAMLELAILLLWNYGLSHQAGPSLLPEVPPKPMPILMMQILSSPIDVER